MPPVPGLAQRIDADILLGSLQPGEWLRLAEMEQRYDATRFEVRGALARLAATGVLDHVPNRGHRVTVVGEDELSRRVEIRLLLELPLCELVARQAAPADCDALLALARRFEWAIEHATIPELDAANHRFHRALVRLCGNPDLEQLINELRERSKPRGWMHWKTVAHSRQSAADHLAMVEALRRADGPGLRGIVRRHILRLGPPPRDALLQALA